MLQGFWALLEATKPDVIGREIRGGVADGAATRVKFERTGEKEASEDPKAAKEGETGGVNDKLSELSDYSALDDGSEVIVLAAWTSEY